MVQFKKRNLASIFIPLVIFFISGCHGDSSNLKAIWYSDALSDLPAKYKRIKIAIVYSERWVNDDGTISDLRINSSNQSLDAFIEGISKDYFFGKESLTSGSFQPPDSGCFTGIFPGWGEFEDSIDKEYLEEMEQLIGKSFAFVPFSVFFGKWEVFDRNLQEIDDYGAIPLVRFMPWGEPYWEPCYQPAYDLESIISGKYDTFLLDWANCIKNFGKTVMVTFGVEMNGNWFPWSGIFQGGSTTGDYGDTLKPDGPEKYVDAYRHIVNIFRGAGVNNVLWYFHVNNESYPDSDWNSIERYYPGDSYVDWVGFSLYGAQYADEDWRDFDEIMRPIYSYMINTFPNKPLMLAEWGVMER